MGGRDISCSWAVVMAAGSREQQSGASCADVFLILVPVYERYEFTTESKDSRAMKRNGCQVDTSFSWTGSLEQSV